MAGKYEKKGSRKAKHRKKCRNSNAVLWIVIVAAIIALAAAVALLLPKKKPGVNMEHTTTSATADITTENMEETKAIDQVILGQGMVLSEVGGYNGLFMEDGTDEIVSNILKVKVTNTSEKPLQYAEISLETTAGTAYFSVSTLNPGDSAVLLEKNRMNYVSPDMFVGAKLELITFFQEPLSLREDILEIQTIEEAVNITNISDKDLQGDIVVYYKNWSDGMYYGGITYRVTVEDGLEAGEIRQIMPNHFSATASKIVMVACEEA